MFILFSFFGNDYFSRIEALDFCVYFKCILDMIDETNSRIQHKR